MPGWLVVVILLAMVTGAIVIVVVSKTDEKRRSQRLRRFELRDTGERLPLAAPPSEAAPAEPPKEDGTYLFNGVRVNAGTVSKDPRAEIEPDPGFIPEPTEEHKSAPHGRFVNTPDGEMLLTEPPFRLRETLFTKRNGRYAQALLRRLPPWLMICPRVRLDSILTPHQPRRTRPR